MTKSAGNMSSSGQGTSRHRFLSALAETGSVRLAAEASGRMRTYWLKQRQEDGKFAKLWDQALDAYIDVLEAEADRRALCGDEEPIFYGGKQVGVRSKPSDSLLMFRLKALRPTRYKEAAGDAGSQIKVEVKSFRDMQPILAANTDTHTVPGEP